MFRREKTRNCRLFTGVCRRSIVGPALTTAHRLLFSGRIKELSVGLPIRSRGNVIRRRSQYAVSSDRVVWDLSSWTRRAHAVCNVERIIIRRTQCGERARARITEKLINGAWTRVAVGFVRLTRRGRGIQTTTVFGPFDPVSRRNRTVHACACTSYRVAGTKDVCPGLPSNH